MSDIGVIRTGDAPEAIGPYSQATTVDGWVFCSGQIPLDPHSGELVEGDVAAQTEQVMRNLRAVLAAAGASLDRVVKTTVFLADLADFQAMNQVYSSYFPSEAPARVTVQVAGLVNGGMIEIAFVAVKTN